VSRAGFPQAQGTVPLSLGEAPSAHRRLPTLPWQGGLKTSLGLHSLLGALLCQGR